MLLLAFDQSEWSRRAENRSIFKSHTNRVTFETNAIKVITSVQAQSDKKSMEIALALYICKSDKKVWK